MNSTISNVHHVPKCISLNIGSQNISTDNKNWNRTYLISFLFTCLTKLSLSTIVSDICGPWSVKSWCECVCETVAEQATQPAVWAWERAEWPCCCHQGAAESHWQWTNHQGTVGQSGVPLICVWPRHGIFSALMLSQRGWGWVIVCILLVKKSLTAATVFYTIRNAARFFAIFVTCSLGLLCKIYYFSFRNASV